MHLLLENNLLSNEEVVACECVVFLRESSCGGSAEERGLRRDWWALTVRDSDFLHLHHLDPVLKLLLHHSLVLLMHEWIDELALHLWQLLL